MMMVLGLSGHVSLDWPLIHWFIRISLHFIMNIAAVARLSEAPVRLDHVRPLLRDHDRGGVGVPRHHVGHDASVDDPQSRDAIHLQISSF